MLRATFNSICQHLSTRLSQQDTQFRQSCMNSDMTVQTEIVLQKIRPVSYLGPHMKVAKIRIEKIRFHVIFAVHIVVDLGYFPLQSEYSLRDCGHSKTE